MNKLLYLFLFSLIIVSLICINVVSAYENTEFGFTIDSPLLWDLNENTGTDYISVAFENSYTGSSINIGVEETYDSSLLDNIEGIKVFLEGSFDDFNLVYEVRRVIGGLDCYEIVYTATLYDLAFKTKQVVFVEGGMGYVITCNAFESEFSSSLLDFENSITSFRITSDSTALPLNLDMIIIVGLVIIVIIVLLLVLFMLKKGKDVQSSIQQPDSSYVSHSPVNVKISVDSVPKFCRNCGAETKVDTVFCEKCGKQLKE